MTGHNKNTAPIDPTGELALIKRLAKLQVKRRARVESGDAEPPSAEVFSIEPRLRGDEQALPNTIVRSAVFTANNRRVKRRRYDNEEIFTYGEVTMLMSGVELRTDDEDLFLFLVPLFDGLTYGATVDLLSSEIIKGVGKQQSAATNKALVDSLWRLKQCSFRLIFKDGRDMMCGLLDSAEQHQAADGRAKNGAWRIMLSPKGMRLFADKQITKLEPEIRRQLPAGIARKLHSWLTSHRYPFPAKVENLYWFCFNRAPENREELRRFRSRMKKAWLQMQDLGVLREFGISPTDLVELRRKGDMRPLTMGGKCSQRLLSFDGDKSSVMRDAP
ncbi:MAG: plasmid replication initiator TrfA [Burkholderiaceae bacterium]